LTTRSMFAGFNDRSMSCGYCLTAAKMDIGNRSNEELCHSPTGKGIPSERLRRAFHFSQLSRPRCVAKKWLQTGEHSFYNGVEKWVLVPWLVKR